LVVIHLSPDSPGVLSELIQKSSRLPVRDAQDGEALKPGEILVARPDLHLGVDDHRARVWRGPKENRHRPGIDVTMRSVAAVHGPRAIGVVLTGLLDDGTAGLWDIKRAGGIAIVQDPAEAEHPQMPQSAVRRVGPHYVLPVDQISAKLVELVR